MRQNSTQGFTLVEILVVMMIIGVIASMLLVNFQDARTRSRDSVRKADLRQVKSALQLYYNDYQQFPDSNGGSILGCGVGAGGQCSWGGAFAADGTTYMNALPLDPLNSGDYVYEYTNVDADTYTLSVSLENASDQDALRSQERCGVDDAPAALYVVCQD